MSQTRAQLVKGLSNTSGSDDTITIDSTGRIGLDDTPTAQFTGHSLFQIGAQASLGANKTLSTTGQTFLSHNLYFDTSGNYQVFNTSSANEGAIIQLVDGSIRFRTSAATTGTPSVGERVRIDTNGLKFNGDTAAANALDDYEEGTFTPSINSGFTASYDSQAGRYTKVGNVVHFFINIDLSSISGSSSDVYAEVEGLPFTATNTGNIDNAVTVAWQMNLGNSVEYAYIEQNATSIVLLGEPSGGSRTHWNPGQVWDDNNGKLALSGTYTTTA